MMLLTIPDQGLTHQGDRLGFERKPFNVDRL